MKMQRDLFTIVGTLVIGLLAWYSYPSSAHAQGGGSVNVIVVGVDGNGNPTVDKPSADIWSTNGDTVKWTSNNIPFTVSFGLNTPFAYSTYIGPTANSGAIQHGFSGAYKYSVQVGTKILDPRIIVRP